MNKKTIPITKRKDFIDFHKSVTFATQGLSQLTVRVFDVISNLEDITGAEHEIKIKKWCVRSGEIFVTFEFPKSVIDLSKEHEWVEETFKDCRITGKLVEIPFSSLH